VFLNEMVGGVPIKLVSEWHLTSVVESESSDELEGKG
jgi:hypothetical protein